MRRRPASAQYLSGPPASSWVRISLVKRSDDSERRDPAAAAIACVTSDDGLASVACVGR